MKNYMSLFSLVLLISCNSKSKTDVTTDEKKDTVTTVVVDPPKDDTTVANNPPPSGKIDIETFGGIKLGMTKTLK